MKADSKTAAWRAACEKYSEQTWQIAAQPRAAYFASFGALHLAVAQLLYESSDELNALDVRRVVHIENAADLVATYCPGQRRVLLRLHNSALIQTAHDAVLNLRVLPASASALDAAQAQDFQAWPAAALFWHYGQASLSAIDHLPALSQQKLHIRRFPALEPPALLLRQLHLIHLLSHDDLSFEQLLPSLHEENRAFVCADLASLQLTGALRIGKA